MDWECVANELEKIVRDSNDGGIRDIWDFSCGDSNDMNYHPFSEEGVNYSVYHAEEIAIVKENRTAEDFFIKLQKELKELKILFKDV